MKFTRDKNNIFTYILIGLLVVLLAAAFYWYRKKEKARQEQAAQLSQFMEPVIDKVEIDPPQPVSTDFIRAQVVLKAPVREPVTYRYQWFVNDQLVTGQESLLLDKQHYKKGDTVYCQVKSIMGTYESNPLKSREVKVRNSPPVVNFSTIEPFDIPGQFRYTIQAEDPDGDTLSYELAAPLNQGIDLNPDTGEITWDIREKPGIKETSETPPVPEGEVPARESAPGDKKAGQPPEEETLSSIVKIVFKVRDAEGAEVEASITLNLEKGGEVPQ